MIRSAAIALIRLVSLFFRSFGGATCRFHPSCSEYASQAFRDLPIHRAAWVSMTRILRCQPVSAGGHDPVPGARA